MSAFFHSHLHTLILLLALGVGVDLSAADMRLSVNPAVNSVTPAVTLSWDLQDNGSTITILRRELPSTGLQAGTAFTALASYDKWTTSHTDATVMAGKTYEFRVYRPAATNIPETAAYLAISVAAPLEDQRGTVLLVVDASLLPELEREVSLLELDLAGDGWKVTRLLTQPHGSTTPQALKSAIVSARSADPTINALYLFGRVPYALSGWLAPDGHDNQAHPTDQYYADINGTWTDTTNYPVIGGGEYGSNLAGDGKLDQSNSPSASDLMTGRVDFSKMVRVRKNEREFLRDYIQKSHAWRHAQRQVPYRALASEGMMFMEISALRGMFGPANCPDGGFPETRTAPQTWTITWGNDGSQFDSYYAAVDNKVLFTLNFASGKQVFSQENNLMRVLLAQPDWGLTCGWGARPAWHVHHMAAGKTIGDSFLRTVNNGYMTPQYQPRGEYSFMDRYVSINLMGDPTLRMQPVAPARDLRAANEGAGVRLDWNADAAALLNGFHIYRSASRTGAYSRLTTSPLSAATRTYLDSPRPAGDLYYQVRAVHQAVFPTGTFANASQGVFAWVSGTGATRPALPAIVHPAMQAQTSIPTPVVFPAAITANPALTPIVLTNPANGMLRWNGGRAYYVSKPGYTGNDAFIYRLSDGVAVGDLITVAITVTANNGDVLLGWSFGDPGWNEQPTACTLNGDLVLPDNLQRGSGVAVVTNQQLNAGGYYINGCDATGLDVNDWLGWNLTPDGSVVNLKSLVFFAAAGGQDASAPMAAFGMELRVSVDGFATAQTVPFEQAADTLKSIHNKANGGRIYSADLSGITALQNRSGPVSFRLYVWGTPSFSLGRSGDNSAQNAMDLVVFGTAIAPAGAFRLSSAVVAVDEGGVGTTTIVPVTVFRAGGALGAVSVTYATADVSASAGQDYMAASGVLSWADGDNSSRTIPISISGDNFGEMDETLKLSLSAATGGAKIAYPTTTVITIRNDDALIPIARINFQPSTDAPPAGWLRDSGDVYASRGNSFTYGWDVNATSFVYIRPSNTVDYKLRTLIHMQNFGVTNWEFAIANGTYIVHLVAGDPDYNDSVHRINVEGTLVVDGTPTSASPWIEGTAVVTVADGKLSVTNASGAINNKLDYLEIFQYGAAGNQSPTVQAGADQTITLPAIASLNGSVTDDGLPSGSALTTTWSKISGPGTVTFANAAAGATTATFSVAGTYVLRLSASDTNLSDFDETTITVASATMPAAATPTISPPAGTYGTPQIVTLSTTSAGASLRYTTDGTLPTSSFGTVYGGAFTVSASQTINAIAYGSSFSNSSVGSSSYVILPPIAPSGLSATPGVNQIRLDWIDNATTETGYRVQTLVAGGAGAALIAPGNAIVGTSTNTPAAEGPGKAIDGLSTTKYLNFDKVNAGFTVTLAAPGAATMIDVTSADDVPARDPSSVSIFGSNDGSAFTTIAANVTIPAFSARLQLQTVTFANATAYAYYRIIFPTTVDPTTTNCMQIAEVQLKASGSTWVDVVTLPAGSNAHTITGLAAGTSRTYRVCAFSAAGNSAWAGPITSTPLASGNQAPLVSAGPDQAITLPAIASLSGTASDDGLPIGSALTTTWSKISGPGTVTFANTGSVATSTTFSVAGTYVLRLSASDTALGAADDVTVTVAPAGPGLPAGWTAGDIGTVAVSGTTQFAAGVWTLGGSGSDIAGTQDALQFAAMTATGDVMITVRVDSLAGPSSWSMAGVMIRETANTGSPHATTDITLGRGTHFRRRLAIGGTSALTNGAKGTTPYWVRIERVGNVFKSSASSDGVVWKLIRSETIAMGATVRVGLAVCSRSDGQLASATFSNVSIASAALVAQ